MIFSTASLSFSWGCNQTEQFQIVSQAKWGSDIHEAIGHGAHTHEHVQQEEDVNHCTYCIATISNNFQHAIVTVKATHILRQQRAPLFILCSACDNGNLAGGLTVSQVPSKRRCWNSPRPPNTPAIPGDPRRHINPEPPGSQIFLRRWDWLTESYRISHWSDWSGPKVWDGLSAQRHCSWISWRQERCARRIEF